jgi:precorrin-6B methylase 2
MSSIRSAIKRLLPAGRQRRRVVRGIFYGLQLHLDLGSETLIWLGLYEQETHFHLVRLSTGAASFLDIGAGKGELVCWWLRRFPGMPVMAVEPNPRELDILRLNVAANFEATPAALSIWPGFAGPGAATTHRELGTLCAGVPDPVFIKLDIDGGEADLLQGSTKFLAAHPCRLLVEVHSLELESSCLKILRECGYQCEIVDFAWWRRWLPERRPIPHNRWISAQRVA